MTTTTLHIDTSARKIHQSTTVNATLIWKIYRLHEPKSKQKLTGTLVKPSPLTPLQLPNPPPKKPSNSKSKPKRLSRLEFSEFMVKNIIHHATELYAAAEERRREGQADFAGFVLPCTKKSFNDLIENTWEMQNAKATLEREKTSRMQVLEKARLSSCVDGCDMEWYICSRDILQKNSINPYVYADAIRDLLMHGRGKFRIAMTTGPANYGKTFMLKPLEIIYHAFSNPANDKYAWVGADNAEVIILQNFRWSSGLICWKDLLLLLEGKPVKLTSPKNQFVTDVCIKTDIPIFATSKTKNRTCWEA